RVGNVCTGLINCRHRSPYIRLFALNVCGRHGYGADQSRNSSPLVRNLSLQSRLVGDSFFKSILVRSRVDLEKDLSFFYELVVMHIQVDERAFDLRRDSNEVGENLAIICPGIAVRVIEHHNPQTDRAGNNERAQNAPNPDSRSTDAAGWHRVSSLSKQGEP